MTRSRPPRAMLHQRAAVSLASAPAVGRSSAARPAPCSPCGLRPASRAAHRSTLTVRSAKGDGPLGAWLDLASLVTSGSMAPGMSDFAKEIGSGASSALVRRCSTLCLKPNWWRAARSLAEIYADISGWHLVRAGSAAQRRRENAPRTVFCTDGSDAYAHACVTQKVPARHEARCAPARHGELRSLL